MNKQQQSLQDIQQIKQMMERSSRFISLSGLSGIAAGTCALIGAWLANSIITDNGGPSGYREAIVKGIGSETLQDFWAINCFRWLQLLFVRHYSFLFCLLICVVKKI